MINAATQWYLLQDNIKAANAVLIKYLRYAGLLPMPGRLELVERLLLPRPPERLRDSDSPRCVVEEMAFQGIIDFTRERVAAEGDRDGETAEETVDGIEA